MENDKVIQKIGKWAQYTQDPKAVVFDELDAISDKLDEVLKTLEPLDFSQSDEVKGETGYSPQYKKDFLTDEELEEIKEEILAKAKPIKGEDYFTNEELQAIIEHVTPRKGEHYNDGLDGLDGMTPDIEEIKKLITSDEEFIAKLKGKDGDNADITGEYIAEELNKTTASIDFKVIKGLSEKLMQQKSDLPASIRLRAKIAGVEQNEPIGSINFPSGTTHTGMDYTVAGGGSTVTVGTGVLTGSDYVTTFTPTLTPIAGSLIVFIPNANSVDNATLNGVNIKEVTDTGLNNIEKDDFIAGAFYELRYNGTNWVVEGSINKTIQAWTASSNYDAGQLLSVGTRIVQRTLSGTSGLAFDSTEAALYTIVKPIDKAAWVASTYYYAGEDVINNGNIYTKIASGITTSQFDTTERALWLLVEVSGSHSIITATTYYEAGQIAHDPDSGRTVRRVVAGYTSATIDNTEKLLWSSDGAFFRGAWTTPAFYFVGDIITQLSSTSSQKLYTRTTAGDTDSATNFDVAERANWTEMMSVKVRAIVGSTYYESGEQALDGGRLIRRTTAGFTGAINNTERANWTGTGTFNRGTWVTATYYYLGDIVSNNGVLYIRTTAGISGLTFDVTEAGNYTVLSVPTTASTWAGVQYYPLGYLVQIGGRVLKRTTAGVSNATFDNVVEAPTWTMITNSVISNWTALTYYYTGEKVKNNGGIWAKKVSGVSTGIFDDIEILLWDLISGNNVTTVAANYTVLETDDMINITSAALFTITIPAGRVNNILKFSTGSLGATPPTIATSGGETIIHPSTYASVTSFTMPGLATFGASVQFQLVGTQWRFIA